MVRKIFWEDPYMTHLDATVTGVSGADITVDQTIFFAFSGGQESDRGRMGEYPVLGARKDGREIIYTLEEGHRLLPGDSVHMAIDWDRRYRLMRLHFAAEIILELVYQHTPSIRKTGAHIAADKARLDFEWQGNIAEIFPRLQKQADEIIAADRTITSAFSDEAAEKRCWEIRGFARVPCGGTHLRRTGEVGAITLKRKNPGRGRERIEIHLSNT